MNHKKLGQIFMMLVIVIAMQGSLWAMDGSMDVPDNNLGREDGTPSICARIPVDSNRSGAEKTLNTYYGQLIDCECGTLWAVGDRVMASRDILMGASVLRPEGSLGTVVCAAADSNPPLLVAWDDWSGGHGGNDHCTCPALAAAQNSGWYVECDDVEPAPPEELGNVCGGTYSIGSRVVSRVDNPGSAIDLPTGSKGTVVCGNDSLEQPLLVSWDGWNNGNDGNDLCTEPLSQPPDGLESSWWFSCQNVSAGSEASCVCAGVFEPGDRVRLLEDSGWLTAGALGSVVCGTSGNPPLLVTWDNFTLGHNGNDLCSCPSETVLPDNSGYFVMCSSLAKEYASLFIDGFENRDISKWSERNAWWCPDGATDEGIGCPTDGEDSVLDPNGGCNSNPDSFGSISIGETICGLVGTYETDETISRDTDWYAFTAPSSGSTTITVKSDTSLLIGFVDVGDCSSPSLIESLTTTAGEEATLTTTVDAGSNTVFIASSDYSDVPCTGYTVTLTQP